MRRTFRAQRAPSALLLALAAVSIALSGCTAVTGSSMSQQLSDVPFLDSSDFGSSSNGIEVLEASKIGSRSFDLHLSTTAVADGATSAGNGILVTLPVGYNPQLHYPVIYLLPGTSPDSSYQDWFEQGSIESVMASRQQIAVMPDDGIAGWYTNWNGPAELKQDWQTYHLDQLIPWVDDHLSTVATPAGRTIAGASAGGYGAIHYAEARPDLFATAISLSGALDLAIPEIRTLIQHESEELTGNANLIFGDGSTTSEQQWNTHDPLRSIGKLGRTTIALYAGPGQEGNNTDDPQQLEWLLKQSAVDFNAQLSQNSSAGNASNKVINRIGSTLPGCDGGHNWDCWSAALSALLPELASSTIQNG